ALRQLAHRDDVVKRVLLELEPFDRMLVGVRRALAEQLNQLLAARCLLCVFAEREYLAEQVQLARQTMGVGARPRAVPSGDRWHGERPLVHGDDAIELRVMRDDLHVRCSPRHHEAIRRVESRIPYASRTVVDGVGHKANARLRMPRIAVEADVLGATTVQGTGVRRNDLDIEVEAVLKSHRRSQVRLRALQVNVQRRQKPASVPARDAGPRVTARARHIGRAVRTPLAVAYDLVFLHNRLRWRLTMNLHLLFLFEKRRRPEGRLKGPSKRSVVGRAEQRREVGRLTGVLDRLLLPAAERTKLVGCHSALLDLAEVLDRRRAPACERLAVARELHARQLRVDALAVLIILRPNSEARVDVAT